MRVAVVNFPGSNSEEEALRASATAGLHAYYVWHRDTDLKDADVVILPGGFSYGDYLRSGAIARFSPIMKAVVRHAEDGGAVLGICNGFQILCEAGLLPGALGRNAGLLFISRPIEVAVEQTDTPFTAAFQAGDRVIMRMAHGEGRFTAPEDLMERLEANRQIVFRYAGENPNGSLNAVAGVCSEGRNVVGVMPHPERQSDRLLDGDGRGQLVFESILKTARVA